MNISRIPDYTLPDGLVRFDEMKFNPSQKYQILSSFGYQKGDSMPVVSTNEGGLFPYFFNSKDQKSVMLLKPNSDGSWIITRGSRSDMEATIGFNIGAQVEAGKLSGGMGISKEFKEGEWQEINTGTNAEYTSAVNDQMRDMDKMTMDTPMSSEPVLKAGAQVYMEAYARRDTVEIGVLQESGAMTTIGIESTHGYVAGEIGISLDGTKLNQISDTLSRGTIKDLKSLVPFNLEGSGEVCGSKGSGLMTFREAPEMNPDGKVDVQQYKIEAGACAGYGREFNFSDGTMRLKAGPLSLNSEKTTEQGEAFSEGQIEHIENRPKFIEKIWGDLKEMVMLKEDQVDNQPQPIPAPGAPTTKAEVGTDVMMPNMNVSPIGSEGATDGDVIEYGRYWFDPGDKDGYINVRGPDGNYQRLSLEDAIQNGLIPPGTTTALMTQYRVSDDEFLNLLNTSDRNVSRADRIDQTFYPDGITEPGNAKNSSINILGETGGLGGGTADQSITTMESEAEDHAAQAESNAARAEAATRRAGSAARRASATAARLRALIFRRGNNEV